MALYLLIAFPLCALLLYYVFKDYPLGVGDVATSGLIDRTMIEKEKRSKFLFFLTDGDEWLKKKNYHNAVFQYKKALEIYPSEYSAYYRLANAYTYQCQYNFKGCDEGHKLVKKLKNQYSGSTGLQKMEEVFKHWGIP